MIVILNFTKNDFHYFCSLNFIETDVLNIVDNKIYMDDIILYEQQIIL